MATLYTNVGQNQADAASTLTGMADRAAGANVGGQLLVSYSTFTTTTTTATGDVINIVQLPGGARIVPALLRIYVSAQAFATSCTATLGLEQDADLYAIGINMNAASSSHAGIAITEEILGEALTVVATPQEWLQLTITAVGACTAGISWSFLVPYVVSR